MWNHLKSLLVRPESEQVGGGIEIFFGLAHIGDVAPMHGFRGKAKML